jgi:O-methyltransferase/8-demethyl-8-(2,3-dimethoxy-alpha-L-rhamnosyl)tetracenomycin-C 4'-O-methyltransferase
MNDFKQLYLDVVRKCITGMIYCDPSNAPWNLSRFDEEARLNGGDWPTHAHTMIGDKRMRNIETLANKIFENNIPGDFMETGVWRGGACIFMNAIFEANNVSDRRVFVCDSFEGLPPPDPKYPADNGDNHHTLHSFLAVSLDEVKTNFESYGLLNDRAVFVKGFFRDTMPTLINDVDKIALLRLDGDMYESTIDVLNYMYPKVSTGGYVIVDDWQLSNCRAAVGDYAKANNFTPNTIVIDGSSVYWKKEQ